MRSSRPPDGSHRSPQCRTRPPTDDAALAADRSAPVRRRRCESAEATGAEGTLIHHALARDRPVGDRGDRAGLRGSVDDGGGRPGHTAGARSGGTPLNSRRGPGHRTGKSQTARDTSGTSGCEALIPRGRSTARAPSTISVGMGEWCGLIRPAAASSRSRGPGGSAPGPHARSAPTTPYLKLG